MRVSVFGLGKLGTCIAALYAKGHQVIGVDKNELRVEEINARHTPFYESGLAELLQDPDLSLQATTDVSEAVLQTDVSFVIVPTPSKQDGSFDSQYVLQAVEEIGKVLAEKDDWHLVVVCSTVMPGTLQNEVIPMLYRTAGHHNWSVAYNPSFIALGSVLRDLQRPDFVLIGEEEEESGHVLADVVRTVAPDAPIQKMSLLNAEITKLGLNQFLVTKISWVNELAEICDNTRGADAAVILEALGHDARIGSKLLQPGTAAGGPCLPRDSRAFNRMATKVGVHADLSSAADRVNNHQAIRIASVVLQHGVEPVGILGLTYKPGTYVTEESTGLAVAKLLQEQDIKVMTYDPMADGTSSLDEVMAANTVVIATAWSEFAELKFEHQIVIDCWGIVPEENLRPFVHYMRLGKG